MASQFFCYTYYKSYIEMFIYLFTIYFFFVLLFFLKISLIYLLEQIILIISLMRGTASEMFGIDFLIFYILIVLNFFFLFFLCGLHPRCSALIFKTFVFLFENYIVKVFIYFILLRGTSSNMFGIEF